MRLGAAASTLTIGALACALAGPSLHATDLDPAAVVTNDDHVRVEDPTLRASLADGINHSSTFKGLVDRLQASDVVVYLVYDRTPRPSLASHISFLSAAGGRRYLMIGLTGRLPRVRQVSIIGHELQHAVEIAGAPGVIDARSMARFYADMKYGGNVDPSSTHHFETRAALDVEHRIAREIAPAKRDRS